MKTHSVIFIDQFDEPKYERLDRRNSEPSLPSVVLSYFRVVPWELPKRVLSSFVPPVFGAESRRVYVDFVGPLTAVVLLWLMLSSGHSDKQPQAMLETPPSLTLTYYSLAMPTVVLFLAKLGESHLSLPEVVSLLGYALYGHVAAIFLTYLFDMAASNFFFFTAMVAFGGLSTLRLVIVLLMTIPKPAARLLVCAFVSIIHLLFLVFVHFAYMHSTFVYGGSKYSRYEP